METYVPKETLEKIKDKELHRIVTTVIIYRSTKAELGTRQVNQYLVTQRSMKKKMMPGKWTVPGGGLDIDDYIHIKPATETAPQWYGALSTSMMREIKEEVNVEIGKPELLTDLTFIRSDGVPCICFSYYAPYISGEVKLDEDSVDFKWVTLEEAKKYDLIEGIWDEIHEVSELLKSK